MAQIPLTKKTDTNRSLPAFENQCVGSEKIHRKNSEGGGGRSQYPNV